MAEALKAIYSLYYIHKSSPTPFLTHLFKTFDPTISKSLTSSIKYYGNAASSSSHDTKSIGGPPSANMLLDYRSALDALHDWVWGWEVNATTDIDDEDAAEGQRHHRNSTERKQQRVARVIRMHENASERAEAEKIITTFVTLLTLSRRALRALYMDIEKSIPRIGSPDLFEDLFGKTDDAYDTAESERVWAHRKSSDHSNGHGAGDSTDSLDIVHQATLMLQREKGVTVRAVRTGDDSATGSDNPDSEVPQAEALGAEGDPQDDDYVPPPGFGQLRSGASRMSFLRPIPFGSNNQNTSFDSAPSCQGSSLTNYERNGVHANTVARTSNPKLPAIEDKPVLNASTRKKSQAELFKEVRRLSLANRDKRKSSDTAMMNPESRIHGLSPMSTSSESILSSGRSTPEENHRAVEASEKTQSSLTRKLIAEQARPANLEEMTSQSLGQLMSSGYAATQQCNKPNHDLFVVRRHIDRVLSEIDKATDLTLTCASSIIVILALSEATNDIEIYSRHLAQAHEIANEFVASLMKCLLDVLIRESPAGGVDSDDVKDLGLLADRLKAIYEDRLEEYYASVKATAETMNGPVQQDDDTLQGLSQPPTRQLKHPKLRKFDVKFALLHNLLAAVDVYVFPCAIRAHTEGCKSAQCSRLGPNLWLTSGYDCMIKIHDLDDGKQLAQYAGHTTIVTSARFAKEETVIVSSSFDKVVRMWNSTAATCDRILSGHVDAVTCCDVSVDNRFIVTASTDLTVKMWDFNSGECLSTIKRHTKWVKVVRFTPDARCFLSGGLDKRIFVWDTKAVLHSRDNTNNNNNKPVQPLRIFEIHAGSILDIVLHRPNYMLSCAKDGFIKLHDYSTGLQLLNLSMMPSWSSCLAFAPGGEYFAAGSQDSTVTIFKTITGERVRRLRILNGGVLCVAFANNVSMLAVGTVEGFLQLLPL
ncbi:hypothetical protein SeMB42_g05289 [Synchytrium endobioticum]|uniref:Uncharacterized protein n=1 Tax=Synchytrium endobioticum TaxID=286115 RepID=A0A507D2L9_9FUNG|nr:hypothetical protein SeMB42_g05289 [Synchytrium endobioticum]TPX45716.1 hypothetical protein SeLEV6574_g03706 [Synchytrium endobioticum]